MKKQILISLILFCSVWNANAQWSGTSPIWTSSKVGIGITTPGFKFHVKGNENANWVSLIENSASAGHKMYFGYNNNSVTYGLLINGGKGTTNDYDFAVENKFYIKGNGNVGIGTTTPGSRLHIKGTGFNTQTLSLESTVAGNAYTVFANTEGSWITGLSNDIGGNAKYIIHNGTETRFLIQQNGDIGIGTTAPSEKLEVAGNVKASIFKDIDDANYYLDPANTIVSLKTKGSILLPYGENLYFGSTASAGTEYLRMFNLADGNAYLDFTENFYFRPNAGTSTLTIKNNGYVGIGTTAPQSLLAVKGKITAQAVEVTMTGWADYVFKTDYNLATLNEVENFITKNGHLPNVPSALEVEENGINLGEMNKVLLLKIEELTLYMIEQEKRIQELEKKNNN